MEPISLILAALLAGVTQAAGETASAAVKDAYAALREAVKDKLAAKRTAVLAVDEYVADPRDWQPVLAAYLAQVGADRDKSLVALAQAVMAQADPAGAHAGKYVVDVHGASGVQVGDGNSQTNHFGQRLA